VWGAAAVGLYAVVGFLVVPLAARGQLEKFLSESLQRQAAIERVRFNPFTLTGRIEGLDLRDRDGGPLLRFTRLTVNLQVSGLFRRAWRFREIVLEEPRGAVRILADGTLSIADLFVPAEPEEPAAEEQPHTRVIVDRLTLQGGALDFVDRSRVPAFIETFEPINLSVDDLTTIPDERGDHTLSLGIGKQARLTWTGRQTVEPLRLEGRVEITSISLPHLGNYVLAAQPLEIREGMLDVAAGYDIARAPEGGIAVALKEGSLTARDLAVRPRGGTEEDWLEVAGVEVRGARAAWPASQVDIDSVRIQAPRAVAWLDQEGLNWQRAYTAPAGPPAEAPAAPETAAKPWAARIASVDITEGSVRFEDRTAEPAIVVSLTGTEAHLGSVSTDLAAPVQARLSARINETATATVSGSMSPAPLAGELALDLAGLDLVPLRPLGSALPGATLKSAQADLEGKLVLTGGSPWLTFTGGAAVRTLQIAGAGRDRLAAWDRADLGDVRLTLAPDRLRIGKAALHGAFLDFEIDREGNLNLMRVLAGGPPPAPAAAAPVPEIPAPPVSASTGGASFPVEIGRISLHDAAIRFADLSLILPFATAIRSANGSIRDLSTTSAAPARLELEGRVAGTGFVKAEGTMRIADPFASSDVGVIFRGVPMLDLSPYTAQFAGYAVKDGTLDMNLRYLLQERRLVGDHRLVADNLVVGDKVEGAEGGLPIRLAVALLKDKHGRIDLEVPIEGTIDSPEFAYRKVLWQAVKKILVNVAAAPFRALGRLFGAGDEELELVGFVAGRSELPVPEQEKLAKVAAEVASRPELFMEIEGRFDPVTDDAAIRRLRLEQKIDAKRAGEPSLEKILESLYAEAFTPERLEAERARFMPAPATGPPVSPQPAAPAATPPSFDAGGFYDAIRAQLLAAEPVGQGDLVDLAAARAAAIVGILTAPGALDASRVKPLDPSPIKRKKQGSELVASEMTLTAKD
jgi:hypothetical protein